MPGVIKQFPGRAGSRLQPSRPTGSPLPPGRGGTTAGRQGALQLRRVEGQSLWCSWKPGPVLKSLTLSESGGFVPQQTELCEFHHLTVTPEVCLKDKLGPSWHKRGASDGRSPVSRVQREDEAVGTFCVAPGQATGTGVCVTPHCCSTPSRSV